MGFNSGFKGLTKSSTLTCAKTKTKHLSSSHVTTPHLSCHLLTLLSPPSLNIIRARFICIANHQPQNFVFHIYVPQHLILLSKCLQFIQLQFIIAFKEFASTLLDFRPYWYRHKGVTNIKSLNTSVTVYAITNTYLHTNRSTTHLTFPLVHKFFPYMHGL